jgi:hypothetical protein
MTEIIITITTAVACFYLGWHLRGEKAKEQAFDAKGEAQAKINAAYYDGFRYALTSFTPRRDKVGRFLKKGTK